VPDKQLAEIPRDASSVGKSNKKALQGKYQHG